MQFRILLLAMAFALTSTYSSAQQIPSKNSDDLLFLLRQPEHIDQAIKTVARLNSSDAGAINPGNIEIIVCGKAVTTLTTSDARKWIDAIRPYSSVTLTACGLSLSKFNKRQTDLLPGIKYFENGFIRAFELQKQGYLSVEL